MKDVGVKELAETLADLSEHKKPAPAPSPPPASSPPASSPAASSPAASSPAAADALLGRLLDDRYRVLGLLGEGGMGLVYDAKHEILGTPLAIKVLRKDASGDEEAVERLKREAQAASAIGHEHIVDVRDFGRLADGSVYVVMELLDGVDLYRVVREGPLPIDRLRHIAIQICEALGAAHERGIVHRDLKPENVLLIARRGDPDFVKVLDFGIAKVQNASLKLTAAGRVMGTPEYMSPEQCSGGAVDARADVYSLGVMLYEMATGRLPFADRDLVELVRKQIQQPPLAPSVVRPDLDIPLPLEAIILRCLAKKPEERLQSMADVAEALRELKMPAPLPPAAREPHELTTAQARPTPRAIAAPASRRGWIVASIIAILAVAGAALWALSPPGREPPSVPLAASGGEPVAGPPRRVEVERGGDGTAPAAVAPTVPSAPAVPDEPAPRELVLRSDPTGAEVFQGDTLLGRAPVRLERPAEGERRELRVEMRGFQPQSILISSISAGDLRVSLVPIPRRVGTDRSVAPAPPAPVPLAPPPPARETGTHREWRDPWAN